MFFLNFQGLVSDLSFTIKSSAEHKPKIYVLGKKINISNETQLSKRNFTQVAEFIPIEVFVDVRVLEKFSTPLAQEALFEVISYLKEKNVPGIIYPELPKEVRRTMKRNFPQANSEQQAVEMFFECMGSATLSDPVNKKATNENTNIRSMVTVAKDEIPNKGLKNE
jgi:hypothetical protein